MALWPLGGRKRTTPTPPPGSVAGVVPAAGSSARMGRPKSLLDAGGRSFLAAAVGTLVGGGCRPVAVVLSDGGRPEEKRKAEAAGAVPLRNPEPGEGPITSIRLAIQALDGEAEGIAVLPVDHPLVRPETVQILLAAFRAGDAPVVLPTHGGKRGHPGLFRHTVFAELLDPALEGGARTVVHAYLDRAQLVEVDDPGVLADIDTPEAYRAAFPVAYRTAFRQGSEP